MRPKLPPDKLRVNVQAMLTPANVAFCKTLHPKSDSSKVDAAVTYARETSEAIGDDGKALLKKMGGHSVGLTNCIAYCVEADKCGIDIVKEVSEAKK